MGVNKTDEDNKDFVAGFAVGLSPQERKTSNILTRRATPVMNNVTEAGERNNGFPP